MTSSAIGFLAVVGGATAVGFGIGAVMFNTGWRGGVAFLMIEVVTVLAMACSGWCFWRIGWIATP